MILYKILAVVMLGALYYYFFITTRQRFEPRVRSPTCRSANNNTNDILLSVLTRGIYIYSTRALFQPPRVLYSIQDRTSRI